MSATFTENADSELQERGSEAIERRVQPSKVHEGDIIAEYIRMVDEARSRI